MANKKILWTGKQKKLTKGQKLSVKLNQGRIILNLGSSKNKFAIQKISPWFNFPGKNQSLTRKHYFFDPKLFNPQNPASTARKLIGEYETLIIGSIRNQLYLGQNYKHDKQLSPEHLTINLRSDVLTFENLSSKPTTVIFQSKKK